MSKKRVVKDNNVLSIIIICFFFIKIKKVKYGIQRDENRTEIYSKIY